MVKKTKNYNNIKDPNINIYKMYLLIFKKLRGNIKKNLKEKIYKYIEEKYGKEKALHCLRNLSNQKYEDKFKKLKSNKKNIKEMDNNLYFLSNKDIEELTIINEFDSFKGKN